MSAGVLEGLDPQQRAAAEHRIGPALVVAGAGAGKTTVLVRRVAHLVATGVAPQSIMLLTFTRAAAKSIVQRARAFDPGCDGVFGGTFHSVAARIIRESHATFELPPGFTILDPSDVEDSLKRLADAEGGLQGMKSSSIAKVISFAVNTRPSADEPMSERIESVLYERFPEHLGRLEFLRVMAKNYVAYKKSHDILDFDDLLEYFAALAEHEDTGPYLRQRFPFVMVDEHQDSNALQLRIVYALGADKGNLMAVGDPAQSIYGFRGAAPSTMTDFARHWPHAKIHLIETNYRSTPEIVEAANLVDKSMRDRFERNLRSSRPSVGVRPQLVHVPDRHAEGDWIARQIADRRDEGVELKKFAVLVRSMRMARHVEVALNAMGIPYIFLGGVRIHEAAHVKDVLSVLRIATNPSDEPAWMRMLTLLPRIGPKKASQIFAEVSKANQDDVVQALSDVALKRVELARAVAALRAVVDQPSASVAVERATIALLPALQEKFAEEWEWRKKDIDAIVDLAQGQGGIEEFLRTVTIDVSVDRRSDGRPGKPDEDSMTVATLHSAKGLEWDSVWIPSFVEGHIPSPFANDAESFEEEKRLAYVAVTRARKELFLMRPATTIINNQQVIAGRSAFENVLRPAVEDVYPDAGPRAVGAGFGRALIKMR